MIEQKISDFSWVPLFEKLADHLLSFKHRQPELLRLMRQAGVEIPQDEDANGKFPLDEIDPFSCFTLFMKYKDEVKRGELLATFARSLGIEAEVLTSFDGVPSTMPISPRVFAQKKERNPGDIPLLWQLFEQVLEDQVDPDTFQNVLNIRKMGKAKITEVLYYVRPNLYFPLNKQTKIICSDKGIPHSYKSWQDYQAILSQLQEAYSEPFPPLSRKGWVLSQDSKTSETTKGNAFDTPSTSEGLSESSLEIPEPSKWIVQESSIPLNQILYGPPGTGKTYQTMSRAVAIIDGSVPADRQRLKQRYRELVQEGRIAFTTFHQSFGYEEFVEGIRAETRDGQVSFAVKPGIFSQINQAAQLALAEQLVNDQAETPIDTKPAPDYDELYDAFLGQMQQTLERNQLLQTSTGKQMEVVELTSQGNINLRHRGFTKTYTVSRNRLKKLWLTFPEISEISRIHQDIRETIGGANTTAYWVIFNELKQFEATFEVEWEEIAQEASLNETEASKKDFSVLTEAQLAQADRFVLIIDEINRGNIAKILGELITLLEPSKRLGAEDEQRITLPYSKTRVGVPANLHLIGTMNTADRSITQLDTALRRRFDFQEVMPQPELLAGRLIDGVVDLQLLLQTLNHRIEYLYDRNHTLGHAYFLGITSVRDLNHVFRDRVLPLLQEYFYGEWEKICLVLGDHPGWKKDEHLRFLQTKHLDGNALFGQAPDLYQQPQHYHLNPSLLAGKMPAEAFLQIYQPRKGPGEGA